VDKQDKFSKRVLNCVLTQCLCAANSAIPQSGNPGYTARGRVRQGLSFGLLGVAADGHYVRINSDYVEKLETNLVNELLTRIRLKPATLFK
jgi:hypothetical protein